MTTPGADGDGGGGIGGNLPPGPPGLTVAGMTIGAVSFVVAVGALGAAMSAGAGRIGTGGGGSFGSVPGAAPLAGTTALSFREASRTGRTFSLSGVLTSLTAATNGSGLLGPGAGLRTGGASFDCDAGLAGIAGRNGSFGSPAGAKLIFDPSPLAGAFDG